MVMVIGRISRGSGDSSHYLDPRRAPDSSAGAYLDDSWRFGNVTARPSLGLGLTDAVAGFGGRPPRRPDERRGGPATLELLGYRQVLIEPSAGYAPAGAVIGWSSYLYRALQARG